MPNKILAGAAAAFGLAMAAPASAMIVAENTTILLPTDDVVNDRIYINGGTPSSWTYIRPWPGLTPVDPGPHHFRNVPITFGPNAQQDVYYDIYWQNHTNLNPHLVAYRDSFDPSDPSLNYLGDYGLTPAGGFDASFQVVVSAGHSLLLHFVQRGHALPSAFTYRVEAFSDANRNENFGDLAPVPEPATWALMIVGFGAVGAAARIGRARRAAPVAT